MSNLTLEVEVSPGCAIDAACDDACALAGRIQVAVMFKFNGVTCTAFPNGDPKELAVKWSNSMESKSQYKFASNRP